MDTSAIVTSINEAGTAAGVIGLAVLVMLVGIAAYKWVRRAL